MMKLKFDTEGLIPAIIQKFDTNEVLMLGYMNQEALERTRSTERVTFFSRSKNRLWVKGETSGNYLNLVDIKVDCDSDALLITVIPEGPTCHLGTETCWGESDQVLSYLEKTISSRYLKRKSGSYVSDLFDQGINKIAQKVGEEAVELVIESKDENEQLFLNEAADLLFHYLILLKAKGYALKDVLTVLDNRRK